MFTYAQAVVSNDEAVVTSIKAVVTNIEVTVKQIKQGANKVNSELTPIAVGDWLVHAASLRSANNFLQSPTTFHGYSS
jgi:hypothetical protein